VDPEHIKPHIPLPSKMTIEATKEFVGGLIMGIIKEDHFDDIKHCLTNTEAIAGEITTALGDFKK